MATTEKARRKRKHTQPEADLLSYRTPMAVAELKIFWNQNAFYVCPKCQTTLEREFQAYCDRCGQCLDWKGYKKAQRIHIHWDGSTVK